MTESVEYEREILAAVHDGGVAATVVQGRLAVAFGIRIMLPDLVKMLEVMAEQGLVVQKTGPWATAGWSAAEI